MAPHAIGSLDAETDVLSLCDPSHVPEMLERFFSVSEPTHFPATQFDIPHILEFFDTDNIAMREAKYMHHNIYVIQVTADTVEGILSSTRKNELHKFWHEDS